MDIEVEVLWALSGRREVIYIPSLCEKGYVKGL